MINEEYLGLFKRVIRNCYSCNEFCFWKVLGFGYVILFGILNLGFMFCKRMVCFNNLYIYFRFYGDFIGDLKNDI